MVNKAGQQQNTYNAVVRPFEKRFDIPLPLDDVKRRFVNRVWNDLHKAFYFITHGTPSSTYADIIREIAYGLGEQYESRSNLKTMLAQTSLDCYDL